MRRALKSAPVLVTALSFFALADQNVDCDLPAVQSHLGGPPPRMLPLSGQGGIAIAWQAGASILLQRFGHDCHAVGGRVVEVNASKDFWSAPAQSGLSDAAMLQSGAIAVAWLLDGEVWVRLVKADPTQDTAGPVKASGPERYTRSEVRIVAGPGPLDGFLVAWASWGQDGDGWGVFARHFSAEGQPIADEQQVNVAWRHFQWQPQVAWCGATLWGLWTNSSSSCASGSGEACMSGPLLRVLGRGQGDGWAPGPEINIGRSVPIAPTLACSGGDSAIALWLEGGGQRVWWQEVRSGLVSTDVQAAGLGPQQTGQADEPRSLPLQQPVQAPLLWQPPAGGAPLNSTWATAVPAHSAQLLHRALRQAAAGAQAHQHGNAFVGVGSATAPDAAAPAAAVPEGKGQANDTFDASARLASHPALSFANLDWGKATLLARDGFLVVLTTDPGGMLKGQLLVYGDNPPRAYAPRKLATGAQLVSAAWDTSVQGELGLVVCWTSAAAFETSNPAYSGCIRRRARWLMDSDGLSLGGELALLLMFGLVFLLCALRHCAQRGFGGTQGRFFQRRGGSLGLSLAPFERDLHTSSERARELQELRAQLEQLPHAPPRVAATSPAARASVAASPTYANDACPICQGEVSLRIALRRCGHTACRDCVLRLIELNQPCHICRGPIDGVQPVYM